MTISLVWAFVLFATGAYESGMHFMDDSRIVSLQDRFETQGYFNTLIQSIASDLNIRFRSFYFIEHITLAYLLGANWKAWAVHHFFIALLTSFLLTQVYRKLGLPTVFSTALAIFLLLGTQSEVFFRTSPAERTGLLLLILGVFIWLHLRKKHEWYKYLAVFCVILAGFTKETFIITIPALIFGAFWYEKKSLSLNDAKHFFEQTWKPVSLLILFMAVSITFIVLKIGGNSIGYVGIESRLERLLYLIWGVEAKMNLKGILMQIGLVSTNLKTLSHYGLWTLLFLLAALSFFLATPEKGKPKRNRFIPWLAIGILFLAFYLPQFLIYIKTGFRVRYLLPVSGAYGLLIGFSYLKCRQEELMRKLLTGLLLVATTHQFFIATNEAVQYAKEGQQIEATLSYLKKYEPSKILFVADPAYHFEPTHAMEVYIKKAVHNETTIFTYFTEGEQHLAADLLKRRAHQRTRLVRCEAVNTFQTIILFKKARPLFLARNCVSSERYNIQDFETLQVWTRK